MPRLPRIYLENALCYVTSKGDGGQRIFKDDEDFKTFLGLLKRYKAQYGFKLFAFCLLPDHFHLLMELSAQKEPVYKMGALSGIMHDLNSSYTKYFNSKYMRKGHLFRERYKSALVEKKPYLLKLTAYLHFNPQRLNLVSHPGQYPYSSYIFYSHREIPREDLINEEEAEVLSLVNGKSYSDFLEQAIKEIDFSGLRDSLQKGILGTDDFLRKVRQAFDLYKKARPQLGGVSLSKKLRIVSLVVIAGALGITYALKLTIEQRKQMQGAQLSASHYKLPFQIKELLRDMENIEWRIRVVPLNKGAVQNDIIGFEGGKFISQNFAKKNYPTSEYFLVIEEDDKIIWESRQEGIDAVAFWRGEINKGEMEGGLRLLYSDGKAQDFSFVSVERKKRGRREDE